MTASLSEIFVMVVLGGWLLVSLGVASGLIKRVPFDLFRLAPRWNLFSAGQKRGQAALAIYYVDTLADGSVLERVRVSEGIREWNPWVPFWSASLIPRVFYRRLAKFVLRSSDREKIRDTGLYRRLLGLIMREPRIAGAVSRRILVYAERTQRKPELLFESCDEPL